MCVFMCVCVYIYTGVHNFSNDLGATSQFLAPEE